MTNNTSSINAKRLASLNAKRQGLVAGIATYEDTAELVHRENLVGVELDISPDGLREIETKNGVATLIYATRVSDGAEIKFWAGRPIEQQLTRIEHETLNDFLWTIVERHYTDKRGIAQLGYFLDYSDGTNGLANGNTPATNRARVAAEKSKPASKPSPVENDEDEDAEETEIPELTLAEFSQLSPSKQAAFMRLLASGNAKLAEAPATPAQKQMSAAFMRLLANGNEKSAEAPATPTQKQMAQVKTPAKTSPQMGEIISFGNGEHELGRGRRPSAVKDALEAGETVYYSKKNGNFYADDKKTVLYSKNA